MATLAELRREKRDAIFAIAQRHGVTGIKVFGSFAQGKARDDSDLDLLVEAGAKTSAFFPGGLIADLEQELGRRVEVVEPTGLNPLLREEILKEAVPL